MSNVTASMMMDSVFIALSLQALAETHIANGESKEEDSDGEKQDVLHEDYSWPLETAATYIEPWLC